MAEVARRRVVVRPLALPALALALLACETGTAPPAPGTTAVGTASSVSASGAPAPTAAPSGSAATSASVATSTSAAPEALAGTWEGSYEAKKGSVALPSGVKDKIRAKDDGKVATGPGKVTVVVDASGGVTGKGEGALGKFTLSGKAEDRTLRATVLPEDPQTANAMTGVLICMLNDGAMKGEIRAAGPDANLVREATVELKKK